MKITTVFLIIGSVLQMASANAAELVCDNVLSTAEKSTLPILAKGRFSISALN